MNRSTQKHNNKPLYFTIDKLSLHYLNFKSTVGRIITNSTKKSQRLCFFNRTSHLAPRRRQENLPSPIYVKWKNSSQAMNYNAKISKISVQLEETYRKRNGLGKTLVTSKQTLVS